MSRRLLPAALAFAFAVAPAFAADNPDVIRLGQRLTTLEADSQLNTFGAYERLQARQAIDALAQASGRARPDALYVAERRVQIAEIAARAPQLRQDFTRIKGDIDQVGSLLVLDPQGRLVISTATATPNANNADRGYFRAHVDRDDGTFIDEAVLGRVTGRVIFNVSRRRSAFA